MHEQRLMQVIGFDHVNLKSRDMERAVTFYRDVLGLPLVRADRGEDGKLNFASLRIGSLLIDLQPTAGDWDALNTGLNHIAILVEPLDLNALSERLRALDVPIVEGPIRRQGAFGYGQSLYVTDPDGHGVEIKHHEFPQMPG